MARRPSDKTRPDGEARPSPSKPKPKFQSERRFFLEFLSVTLGVLLALILEQAATSWRERQRVADMRAAMDSEIADYAEIFNLRLRTDKCITAKLDALEAQVRSGGATPVRDVGRPSYFFSGRGAWSSDATDQLARHIGADVVREYGEIYQGMTEYAEISRGEQDAWVVLQTIEGDEDPIGPERRARLREAIAGARNDRLLLFAIAGQMTENGRELGVERNRSLEGVKVNELAICRALGKGPAAAGAG